MKKNLIFVLMLLVSVTMLFVACSPEMQAEKTGAVLVSFAPQTADISATTTNIAQVGNLYWYYKAEKKDNGIYKTGETSGFVRVSESIGLTEESKVGNTYSYGNWDFTFVGVSSATTPTDVNGQDVVLYAKATGVEVNKDKTYVNLNVEDGNGLGKEIVFGDVSFAYESIAVGQTYKLTISDKVNSVEVANIVVTNPTVVAGSVTFSGLTYTPTSGTITEGEHVMTFTLEQTGNTVGSQSSFNVAFAQVNFYVAAGSKVTISGTLNQTDVTGEVYLGSVTSSVKPVYVNKVVEVESATNKTVKTDTMVSTQDLTVKFPQGVKLAENTATATNSESKEKADAHIGFEYKNTGTSSNSIQVATGQEAVYYELTLNVDGNNTTLLTVEKTLAKGLVIEHVYHNGVEIPVKDGPDYSATEEYYEYDSSTTGTGGKLTLHVFHASPIDIVTKKVVATVGSVNFTTLQEAIDAATTGQTVRVLDNINLGAFVEIPAGKDIALDLNGKTVAYTGTALENKGVLVIHNGAKLTVTGNGKINSGDNCYAAIALTKSGDDATNPAQLVVENGTFVGDYYAIVGNGSRDNTLITINGGIFRGTHSNDSQAIYHPQNGTLTINGGTFEGYSSAIELRAGSLVINGGTFTSTATAYSCNANGNGSTTVGAAIAIAQHNTKKDISVSINGGTFTGVKAISESNPQQNDPAPKVTLNITGGTYNGEITITDSNFTSITGGTFSSDPSAYVAKGYEAVKDSTKDEWTVEKFEPVAKIGDSVYKTLQEAIAAVQNDDVIVMLEDVENAAGIAVNTGKIFTIDFAGHTYTVNKPGAGSSGTQTNAFQLIKGQTITFKNGTINASEDNLIDAVSPAKNIKRFFQSYADVTFENMTIDGTNIYGTNSVAEFANGTVLIKGNTSFTARDGVATINVDTWKGDYPAGAHVTIDTTGSMGDIYCYSEEDGSFTKSTLTILNGTFDSVTTDGSVDDYEIQIKGGTFSSNPSAYVAPGFKAVSEGGKYKVEEIVMVFDQIKNVKEAEGTCTVVKKIVGTGETVEFTDQPLYVVTSGTKNGDYDKLNLSYQGQVIKQNTSLQDILADHEGNKGLSKNPTMKDGSVVLIRDGEYTLNEDIIDVYGDIIVTGESETGTVLKIYESYMIGSNKAYKVIRLYNRYKGAPKYHYSFANMTIQSYKDTDNNDNCFFATCYNIQADFKNITFKDYKGYCIGAWANDTYDDGSYPTKADNLGVDYYVDNVSFEKCGTAFYFDTTPTVGDIIDRYGFIHYSYSNTTIPMGTTLYKYNNNSDDSQGNWMINGEVYNKIGKVE